MLGYRRSVPYFEIVQDDFESRKCSNVPYKVTWRCEVLLIGGEIRSEQYLHVILHKDF
jgi:hypothetical protein